MTYCTFNDIQNGGFFRQDLTKTNINSQPAQTVITNDIIPMVDAKIEDALRMYFVVPVDPTASPLATKSLNRIAKWYVAAEVASRLFLGQTTDDSKQGATWKANADADLLKCQTQGKYLADAVLSNDSPDVVSDLISDNLSGTSVNNPPPYAPSNYDPTDCGPRFSSWKMRF